MAQRVLEIAASVPGATPAACDVLTRRLLQRTTVKDPADYLRRIVRFQRTGEFEKTVLS